MKKVFIISCIFLTSLAFSCSNLSREDISPSQSQVAKSNTTRELRFEEDSISSEEEAIKALEELFLVIAADFKSLRPSQIQAIKDAKTMQELGRSLQDTGLRSDRILLNVHKFKAVAAFLKENKMDIKQFASKFCESAARHSREKRFKSGKMPSCPGLCSQQFNIDMAACENTLALEVGIGLVAGVLSGGLAGAGCFIAAVGGYMICEDTAFMTFDTCSIGCGMI